MTFLDRLPDSLNVKEASFYWLGAEIWNIEEGERAGKRIVIFDYDTHSEYSNAETVLAIETPSPFNATTNLSLAGGFRSERVGIWLLIRQPQISVRPNRRPHFVEDCFNLIEYGRDANFPRSLS